MDVDLQSMTRKELQREVMKLRDGIRKHRDQKGDENCWLDDQFYLYGMLPEKVKVDPELPPKSLMMLNCSRYYDCRKAGKEYVPLDALPKKFISTEWINVKDKIPPYDTRVVVSNIDNHEQCIAYNECYDRLAMTRVDVSGIYQKVPFTITHWYLLPELPYEEKK